MSEVVFNATWVSAGTHAGSKVLILSYNRFIGYYPAAPALNGSCMAYGPDDEEKDYYEYPPCYGRADNATLTMIVERRILECDAFKTMYTASFWYERGMQHVTYETKRSEKLNFQSDRTFEWAAIEDLTIPNNTQAFREWEVDLRNWTYVTNTRAILDAVGTTLEYSWRSSLACYPGPLVGTHQLPNGTNIPIAEIGAWPSSSGNSKSHCIPDVQVIHTLH